MLAMLRSQRVTATLAQRWVRPYTTCTAGDSASSLRKWTSNQKVSEWVEEQIKLCKPDKIHMCDGSQQEWNDLTSAMVKDGVITPLKKENSFLARSDPTDVARVESQTFICSRTKEGAGPTNNWKDPAEMKKILHSLFDGCMKGRTMYVMPFSMGPIGSPISHVGVQVTDSPFVVCNMKIMTRMGTAALESIGSNGTFVPCLHSIGAPLQSTGQKDVIWPCNKTKYIVQFPEERSIMSYGSGYGGNALLGKKCFSLRIASAMARDDGWLAEHMLIMGITNPQGEKKYVAAAFPSACGKTNLAMMNPTLPGWKVETVGDDICWMKFGKDGRLYAINPENGFFGVAPGTSAKSNPNAVAAIQKNTLFTNVALTDDKDVWWEGLSDKAPEHLIDWHGKDWTPKSGTPSSHPNSRFTAPLSQCPTIDSNWDNPKGVPISAIIFGGRRSTTVPLVYEGFNWKHGVFMGASVASEQTAAAEGKVGSLRHDPFAMIPFLGYNMADYFAHWVKLGENLNNDVAPKFFFVNWFKKSHDGKFLWPGFGENSRVLKWIFERCDAKDETNAKRTPIGLVPQKGSIDTSGLNISQEIMAQLFKINPEEWKNDAKSIRQFLFQFGNKLPKGITEELDALDKRLSQH